MLISLKNTSWLFAVQTAGTGPRLQQPQNAETPFSPNTYKQDQEAFVKLHHPPILTPARALLQNTQGSPLALQRSGAVPLLPPTPAAGTRLLSQEKGQGSCLKRSIIQLRLAQISIPLKTKSLPCTSQHNRQTTALMVHEKRKTGNISVITE